MGLSLLKELHTFPKTQMILPFPIFLPVCVWKVPQIKTWTQWISVLKILLDM